MGGPLHRRSVFKKAKIWQFVPTNINSQLMYVHRRGIKPEDPPKPVEILPTVTMGCVAAHACGFHHGGLRAILTEETKRRTSRCTTRDALQDLQSFQVLVQLKDEFLASETRLREEEARENEQRMGIGATAGGEGAGMGGGGGAGQGTGVREGAGG